MSAELPRPELLKQYELVLQEYRFQVQLNWDRTKHYLIFNTAIFGAAIALYKDAKSWQTEAAVALLLLVASLNSYAGVRAIEVGRDFYRRSRQTKTKLEKALGLGEFSILSTPGMRRDHGEAAEGTPETGRGAWAKDRQGRQPIAVGSMRRVGYRRLCCCVVVL